MQHMGFLIAVSLILIPLGIWGIVNPRSQWKVLSAWQYRNPDANQPSEAAYAVTRIGSLIFLGAWVWVVLVMLAVVGGDDTSQTSSTPSDPPSRSMSVPSPSLPMSVDLGPLPVAGYALNPDNPESLRVVLKVAPQPLWWCQPTAKVVAENAKQVEIAAMMEGTPIEGSPPSCDGARPTPELDAVWLRLKLPLGKRVVVTRGPYADAAGEIHPTGPIRTLKVVPTPR